MKKLKNFFSTTFIGGILVLLPIAIVTYLVIWLIKFVSNLIKPLANYIIDMAPAVIENYIPNSWAAYGIAILVIVLFSFIIGLIVKTRLGKGLFNYLEGLLLEKIPFYRTIRDTLQQILGNKQKPFSKVGLANIFGTDSLMTAFVTDEHDYGYTIFVPTGPNPTSGQIFHIKKEQLHLLDADVEETMKTIISAGLGSQGLIDKYLAEK